MSVLPVSFEDEIPQASSFRPKKNVALCFCAVKRLSFKFLVCEGQFLHYELGCLHFEIRIELCFEHMEWTSRFSPVDILHRAEEVWPVLLKLIYNGVGCLIGLPYTVQFHSEHFVGGRVVCYHPECRCPLWLQTNRGCRCVQVNCTSQINYYLALLSRVYASIL